MPVFRQGLSLRFGRGFQGSRVRLVRLNSPPMVGRSTGGRDPNHSDKRNLIVDEFRDKPARVPSSRAGGGGHRPRSLGRGYRPVSYVKC